MAHGTPDWGLVGPKQTTYGLDDLGEAVVRLGSPHLFDRRGDCVFLTDFRDGLGGLYGMGAPGGWSVYLWTGQSRTGAYCVHVRSAAGAGSLVGLSGSFSHPVTSSVGVEWTVAGTVANAWQIRIEWYTGTRLYMARLRLTEATGLLEYSTGAATWAALATLGAIETETHAIHPMKLVVDLRMPTPEFVRAMFSYHLVLMTGIAIPWVPDLVALPHLRIYLFREAVGVLSAWGYVDNVIVTQNEPPFQE